jgi:hypothetical protein
MSNFLPESLPADLVPLLDDVIEKFFNNQSLPENITELYDWFEDDGIDYLISVEATLTFVLNLEGVLQSFYDEEVALENEIEVEQVTDQMRIAYARKEIQAACDFERASYDMLSVYCPAIKGNADKLVFLGCTAEDQGQNGMEIDWWGLYKSQDDFLEAIRNSECFVIDSEYDSISDERILSLWNKN